MRLRSEIQVRPKADDTGDLLRGTALSGAVVPGGETYADVDVLGGQRFDGGGRGVEITEPAGALISQGPEEQIQLLRLPAKSS